MLTKDRFIIPMELELPDIPMEAEPSYGGLSHSHSASGEIVSFVTDIPYRLGDLKIGIEAVQSGSGDPSPDNIRPISGWTGARVTRTGKNLADMSRIPLEATTRGGWAIDSDGWYYGDTRALATAYPLANDGSGNGFVRGFKADSISFSVWLYTASGYTGNPLTVRIRYDDNAIAYQPLSGSETPVKRWVSFTAPTGKKIVALGFSYGSATIFHMKDMQIEFGDAVTDYEPYRGTVYPISWQSEAGTVYGGTLDVTTGELAVTYGIVDMGDMDWVYNSNYDYPYFSTSTNLPNGLTGLDDILGKQTVICDRYNAIDNMGSSTFRTANHDKEICQNSNLSYARLIVQDSNYTDGNAFKTAVSGAKVVYKFATPQTYQLTPTEVMALLGQNNVWADCGDIENLTYFTIDEIEAPVMLSAPLLSSHSIAPALADLSLAEEKTIEQEEEMPEEEIQEETLEEEPEEQPEEVTEDEGLDR